MLALVLAAQIAAVDAPFEARPPPVAAWQRGVAPGACNVGRLVTRGGRAKLQRLGDLPKARHEIAVLRTVAGCQVPVIVREYVEAR